MPKKIDIGSIINIIPNVINFITFSVLKLNDIIDMPHAITAFILITCIVSICSFYYRIFAFLKSISIRASFTIKIVAHGYSYLYILYIF